MKEIKIFLKILVLSQILNFSRSCGDKTRRKDGHQYSNKIYILFLHIVQRKHNYYAQNKTYCNARTGVYHVLCHCVLRRNISVRCGEFYTAMLATLTTSWENK